VWSLSFILITCGGYKTAFGVCPMRDTAWGRQSLTGQAVKMLQSGADGFRSSDAFVGTMRVDGTLIQSHGGMLMIPLISATCVQRESDGPSSRWVAAAQVSVAERSAGFLRSVSVRRGDTSDRARSAHSDHASRDWAACRPGADHSRFHRTGLLIARIAGRRPGTDRQRQATRLYLPELAGRRPDDAGGHWSDQSGFACPR